MQTLTRAAVDILNGGASHMSIETRYLFATEVCCQSHTAAPLIAIVTQCPTDEIPLQVI